MTLKESFINELHNWIDKDYNREHVANQFELITDDYAKDFAYWCEWGNIEKATYTYEELLEIFKKEKGL